MDILWDCWPQVRNILCLDVQWIVLSAGKIDLFDEMFRAKLGVIVLQNYFILFDYAYFGVLIKPCTVNPLLTYMQIYCSWFPIQWI